MPLPTLGPVISDELCSSDESSSPENTTRPVILRPKKKENVSYTVVRHTSNN